MLEKKQILDLLNELDTLEVKASECRAQIKRYGEAIASSQEEEYNAIEPSRPNTTGIYNKILNDSIREYDEKHNWGKQAAPLRAFGVFVGVTLAWSWVVSKFFGDLENMSIFKTILAFGPLVLSFLFFLLNLFGKIFGKFAFALRKYSRKRKKAIKAFEVQANEAVNAENKKYNEAYVDYKFKLEANNAARSKQAGYFVSQRTYEAELTTVLQRINSIWAALNIPSQYRNYEHISYIKKQIKVSLNNTKLTASDILNDAFRYFKKQDEEKEVDALIARKQNRDRIDAQKIYDKEEEERSLQEWRKEQELIKELNKEKDKELRTHAEIVDGQ